MATNTSEPWEFSSRDWRGNESKYDFYITGDPVTLQGNEDNEDGEDEESTIKLRTAIAIVKGNATAGDIPKANARRIVAAVNACQGVSTEALEAGAVKAMVEACAAKDAEIGRLRAKLGPEETNPAHEEQARKFREAMAATEDGKPEGTLEGLATCAKMLNTYAPDCFPANEKGQVHMARVMMESAADEIMAYLATTAKGA